MASEYVYKNHKKLRCGYTTGSCAAAAAKAATRMLLTGTEVSTISIPTPRGITLTLNISDIHRTRETVRCAVKKDAGDDADQTDGILIYAEVSLTGNDIVIEGGIGIGRVTKPGLEQPVGAAAINSTPRQMIRREVQNELRSAGYEEGLRIVISAPEGVKIAQKTFNPRLGIEGGISILGTSGIVEPMSEQALLDTIRLEMNQRKVQGEQILFVTPGNYGQNFARQQWNLEMDQGVKCSNFIGETLDLALEMGFENLLFIGHIGKLVKIAAGVMNTHSNIADARMETLCACGILAGIGILPAQKILSCNTTDDALNILKEQHLLQPAMDIMLEKISFHMHRRTEGKIRLGIVVFSNIYGVLAIPVMNVPGSISQSQSSLFIELPNRLHHSPLSAMIFSINPLRL